jgi:3-hydroxyisobutyrate dehydrogenase
MTNVAVLGTGGMGTAMVRALLRAGFDVQAWNRTVSRAAPLAAEGAMVFEDARDAVRGADVIITVVFDTPALLDVLDQVSAALDDNAVVVQSVTVGVHIDEVIEAARRHGIAMVDAPVLGNPVSAEVGRLSVMAAGNPDLRERVTPVFDAIATRTTWVGDRPGPASLLKLVTNAWVEGLTALAGQSFALAKAFGVDGRDFVSVTSASVATSPYLDRKAAIMLGESDEVMAELALIHKDIVLIGNAARAYGVSTVLHDAVRNLFETATAIGYGKQDVGMVVKAFDNELTGNH